MRLVERAWVSAKGLGEDPGKASLASLGSHPSSPWGARPSGMRVSKGEVTQWPLWALWLVWKRKGWDWGMQETERHLASAGSHSPSVESSGAIFWSMGCKNIFHWNSGSKKWLVEDDTDVEDSHEHFKCTYFCGTWVEKLFKLMYWIWLGIPTKLIN
jgi:hypothetical protein